MQSIESIHPSHLNSKSLSHSSKTHRRCRCGAVVINHARTPTLVDLTGEDTARNQNHLLGGTRLTHSRNLRNAKTWSGSKLQCFRISIQKAGTRIPWWLTPCIELSSCLACSVSPLPPMPRSMPATITTMTILRIRRGQRLVYWQHSKKWRRRTPKRNGHGCSPRPQRKCILHPSIVFRNVVVFLRILIWIWIWIRPSSDIILVHCGFG